jgi:ATP-dependent DNA ligase
VPAGPNWLHEVEYDGYRARLERDGSEVRLYSKSGLDWTWRFPGSPRARKKRKAQFIIDGESLVLGIDGISDFNALHSGKYNDRAQPYAFDCLALAGEDLRRLPLFERKDRLAQLLRGRPDGIFVAPFRPSEIGRDLFCPIARSRET